MARKFFYVCAGMFLLALSYHLGARNAAAVVIATEPSEVAVLSGVLYNGQTIPLPVFADGTTATESECWWTVSCPRWSGSDNFCYTADAVYGYPGDVGPDNGGFYRAHPGRIVNAGGGVQPWSLNANYLIIATRGASQPTPALQESWAQVKARYRNSPSISVAPGSQNK
jgi:hypothetical protein